MEKTGEFLFKVLVSLVEAVKEQPRRVLFRGVSDWYESFKDWAAEIGLLWNIQVTGGNADIVGSRNDAGIDTLVVFYRNEVRERESLNAFRQFDENAIADAVVRIGERDKILPDAYQPEEMARLKGLLQMVCPSVDSLIDFLLVGKEKVGDALPYLGLFRDSDLSYTDGRSWNSRITDNFDATGIRWHDFIDRVSGNQQARKLLGPDRSSLVMQCESNLALRRQVLEQITYNEAIQILNPPTEIESRLMQAGMTREAAADLYRKVKSGEINPDALPSEIPSLPEYVVTLLKTKVPRKDDDSGNGKELVTQRMTSCIDALLCLGQNEKLFPKKVWIWQENQEGAYAEVEVTDAGLLSVQLSLENARVLSTPESGAGNITFQIVDPANRAILSSFSILNYINKLEPYKEWWPDDDGSFWNSCKLFAPDEEVIFNNLRDWTCRLREIVDPQWNNEPGSADSEPTREPNNQIYQIFDLVYLSNRIVFEGFLDAWLDAARLLWRASRVNLSAVQDVVKGLLKFGLAEYKGQDSYAALPYYPLRLIWHRAVIGKAESWLAKALESQQPLLFEPDILREQLETVDRPHALFVEGKKRYLEAVRTPFFSLFFPDSRRKRIRAPLERARQKVEQFGRMWPFSLSRLHLAFQPGDASDDVYDLLVQQAESQNEAAYHVRALVENTGVMTSFDQQLYNTGEETTDLLTQEYHESMRPRVDYYKEPISDGTEDSQDVHVALLVDAFREDLYNFGTRIGELDGPIWKSFDDLIYSDQQSDREELKKVDLSAPSSHISHYKEQQRDIVYVPFGRGRPEYFRMLYDSLSAKTHDETVSNVAYYERVKWDEKALQRLHEQADWVILFDRTLDKVFFQKNLSATNIRLIDFYPRLPGGYRLSISSSRIAEVEWQMAQVLSKVFPSRGNAQYELDLKKTAREIIATLGEFASGLLLKTLGGGSLAQELLGLYATYLSLIEEGVFVEGRDWLIPLDNYQEWFGRRKQSGRRADLLVLRNPQPGVLEMLAAESKWYKRGLDSSFVEDEFGANGQLRTAVHSLKELFDPRQDRLDREYWQRTLQSLLDEAPEKCAALKSVTSANGWSLLVDGVVYVHQYMELDHSYLSNRMTTLNNEATMIIAQNPGSFGKPPEFKRLRMKSQPEITNMFMNR